MKYKHTRKEIEAMLVEAVKVGCGYYSMPDYIFHLIKDSLLAQKEDKKEKLNEMDKYVNKFMEDEFKEITNKQDEFRKVFNKKITPSPLEIEEIEKVKFGMDSNQTFENFYDKINEIIRTVNKLIKNSPIEANSGDMEDRNDSSVNDEMKENYKFREE